MCGKRPPRKQTQPDRQRIMTIRIECICSLMPMTNSPRHIIIHLAFGSEARSIQTEGGLRFFRHIYDYYKLILQFVYHAFRGWCVLLSGFQKRFCFHQFIRNNGNLMRCNVWIFQGLEKTHSNVYLLMPFTFTSSYNYIHYIQMVFFCDCNE